MNRLFLAYIIISFNFFGIQEGAFAETDHESHLLSPQKLNDLIKKIPSQVTLDGKRILKVNFQDNCLFFVKMWFGKEYHFAWQEWPDKIYTDNTGYTVIDVHDVEGYPHVVRTDAIKGRKFLKTSDTLVNFCKGRQTSSQDQKENSEIQAFQH